VGEVTSEVKIEEINSVKKKLSFEIPWSDVKSELDSAYLAVGKKARIKGFRPGKVPRKVLELHYRDDAEGEAISNLVSKSYISALEKNDIMPIDQPVIDQKGIDKEQNFSYTATVEIQPVVEPKDYTGLEVEKTEAKVTKKDVDSRLDQLKEMYATLEDVEEERGLEKGDFAVIDFEVTVDGKEMKELASKNYMLELGAGMFIPGFEDELKGLKKGESKEVSLTLPDNFEPKQIAGKEGVYSVTVKDIREKKVPELDAEFIKNFEKYETLADLKKDIKKTIGEEKKAAVESDVTKKLVDALLEKNVFDVPSAWIERQIYMMTLDTQQRMIRNGMPPDKVMEITANLHDRFQEQATTMVKSTILLNKIAEKESITVEESEIEERLKEMATQSARDLETVKESYEKNNLIEGLKNEILEKKTLEFIKGKATITTAEKKKGEVKEEGASK